MSQSLVRLFAVPVFRRHYLFHVSVIETVVHAPQTPQPLLKSTGSKLQREFQQLIAKAQIGFRTRLARTWAEIEQAKEGSMKSRVYKLSQRVLAKEDPHETVFKRIPNASGIHALEILYPVSLKEAFVRRRFRLLLKQRRSTHKFSLVLWCMGCLMTTPLMLLPIPNLPLYYAFYRLYSNFVVTRRCSLLLFLLHQSQIKKIQATKGHQEDKTHLFNDLNVNFQSCQTMEDVLKPKDRLEHPIADDAVLHISRKYHLPDLLELVARSRRKVTGSMFPYEFS